MQRRDFLAAGAIGAGIVATQTATSLAQTGSIREFKLKYAPHFGMFKNLAGKNSTIFDELRFANEEGFTAWEDNGMKGRSVEEQEKIAETMGYLGMTMGVFVAHEIPWGEPELTSGSKDGREKFLKGIQESVEVAKRVNAKWMTVVPGKVDDKLPMDYQTANVVESLRQAADILEPHELVMVLEPLNWWANHPGQFLQFIPQAYLICKSVDSPSCKILFDIYHQQISEGNIIPNIDRAWDEVAYFQMGDNPGRKEPGTGEINYRNIFKHIHGKGFTGVLGMEHGNSKPGKEGDQAVIDAYVAADDF
jgi:hydroxypyruvate isomerase